MTKLELQTYWYKQWDKSEPEIPPTTQRIRCAITLAVWRNLPPIVLAHPINPDLTHQFSPN